MDDYSADLDNGPDNEGMAQLVTMVDELEDLKLRLVEAEKTQKQLAVQVRKLEQQDIPEYMETTLGLEEVKLTNGRKLSLKRALYGNTGSTKDPVRHAKCISWLEEHNEDAIVKREVIADFDRTMGEEAQKLKEHLVEQGFNVKSKEAIHPQTLNKWIRETIEAGREIDHQLFSIHEKVEVKVK